MPEDNLFFDYIKYSSSGPSKTMPAGWVISTSHLKLAPWDEDEVAIPHFL